MKERQRWRPEEDSLLRAYVKQYGPRDWHLVSERMNQTLNRDAKSCLERWKNYLKPGIKKGSLTEDEQRLVINLQAKHGNKWKKIAAEVPGRTAKRLGKWWEVFKEKQQREEQKEHKPIETGKYDHILETFAEKLTKEKQTITMPAPNAGFLQNDQNATHAAFRQTDQNALHESFRQNDQNGPHIGFHQSDRNAPRGPAPPSTLPPWMASSSNTTTIGPPASPSVTLTLSPLRGPPVAAAPPPLPWLQPEVAPHGIPSLGIIAPVLGDQNKNPPMVSELVECCRELEEGHRAWAAHRKEADWRLKRVELQLESEKACRRREKMEEIEAKVKALREEQKASLDRIEAEYREQLAGLRREAEVKEQKLAEQWAAKHVRLTRFLEQMGCRSAAASEPNGR